MDKEWNVDSDDRDKHNREKGTKRHREETNEDTSLKEYKKKVEVTLEEEQVRDSESDHEEEDDDEFNGEELPFVDPRRMIYKPYVDDFYEEVREISAMTAEEVNAYRKEKEIKIYGVPLLKPIKAWNQAGLSTKILETIKKMNFEKPTPIQAQTLPMIMSGQECIGIAKNGSGKTLAYVLPMLRHIQEQNYAGVGLIALVIAPTRKSVRKIHGDISKFTEPLGLRCAAQKINDFQHGPEILVCTPGRMTDIMRTNGLNLGRVTYLVMDEMDWMFDMGFEPQITRIVENLRPDKQIVLFSATLPALVKTYAFKLLYRPMIITVGVNGLVNKDITQLVEIRPENERFHRLLELLGEWCVKGKILIFVETHERCDRLSRDLLESGYNCLCLREDKDRKSRIADFKTNKVCNIVVATSFTARGLLDVKELKLVINYDGTNCYRDYVQRVGRMGRNKGCAITFVSEEDPSCSPVLVEALKHSEQVIPEELKALADAFIESKNIKLFSTSFLNIKPISILSLEGK